MPVLHVVGRIAMFASMLAVLAAPSAAQGPSSVVSPTRRDLSDSRSARVVSSAVANAFRLPAPMIGGPNPSRMAAAPLWAPVASLVVPGSGQLAMGQARGVAYAVAETYTLLQILEAWRETNARRDEYRRTAREVARRSFGGVEDGPWIYYEDMQDYVASGRYSLATGGAVVPETDVNTANGARWLKARRLYWADVDVAPPTSSRSYQDAIAFYNERVWREGFYWSWADQQSEWAGYKLTIARRNQAWRERTSYLSILLANHLLSAVDGLATVRVRRMTGPRGEAQYEVSMPWPFRR